MDPQQISEYDIKNLKLPPKPVKAVHNEELVLNR